MPDKAFSNDLENDFSVLGTAVQAKDYLYNNSGLESTASTRTLKAEQRTLSVMMAVVGNFVKSGFSMPVLELETADINEADEHLRSTGTNSVEPIPGNSSLVSPSCTRRTEQKISAATSEMN